MRGYGVPKEIEIKRQRFATANPSFGGSDVSAAFASRWN
jgi:hypothetical protein